MSELKVIAMNW